MGAMGQECDSAHAHQQLYSVAWHDVGEEIKYWSVSRASWLPAKVVERRQGGVYLVDKQMRGCIAKVRASEMLSEEEERQSPVLRALVALECASAEVAAMGGTLTTACAVATAPKRADEVSPRPKGLGVVVRADISD